MKYLAVILEHSIYVIVYIQSLYKVSRETSPTESRWDKHKSSLLFSNIRNNNRGINVCNCNKSALIEMFRPYITRSTIYSALER